MGYRLGAATIVVNGFERKVTLSMERIAKTVEIDT
jgi:hypothetical protein